MSLFQSEWYKLRKSRMIFILFVGPLVALFIGLTVDFNVELEMNEWYLSLLSTNLTYALLFLPLITGVLAGVVCRYEHQAGGWKQLLALPITRGNVFVSKYVLLMFLVFVIQLLYLGAIYGVGMVKGFTD